MPRELPPQKGAKGQEQQPLEHLPSLFPHQHSSRSQTLPGSQAGGQGIECSFFLCSAAEASLLQRAATWHGHSCSGLPCRAEQLSEQLKDPPSLCLAQTQHSSLAGPALLTAAWKRARRQASAPTLCRFKAAASPPWPVLSQEYP